MPEKDLGLERVSEPNKNNLGTGNDEAPLNMSAKKRKSVIAQCETTELSPYFSPNQYKRNESSYTSDSHINLLVHFLCPLGGDKTSGSVRQRQKWNKLNQTQVAAENEENKGQSREERKGKEQTRRSPMTQPADIHSVINTGVLKSLKSNTRAPHPVNKRTSKFKSVFTPRSKKGSDVWKSVVKRGTVMPLFHWWGSKHNTHLCRKVAGGWWCVPFSLEVGNRVRNDELTMYPFVSRKSKAYASICCP